MSKSEWPINLKLSKPIEVTGEHGPETIKEITIHEPTAGVVLRYGQPTRTIASTDGDTMEIKMDGQTVRAWLRALAGLSNSEIDQLSVRDITAIWTLFNQAMADAGN